MIMDPIYSSSPLPGKALYSRLSLVYEMSSTVIVILPWDVPGHKYRCDYQLHILPKESLCFFHIYNNNRRFPRRKY